MYITIFVILLEFDEYYIQNYLCHSSRVWRILCKELSLTFVWSLKNIMYRTIFDILQEFEEYYVQNYLCHSSWVLRILWTELSLSFFWSLENIMYKVLTSTSFEGFFAYNPRKNYWSVPKLNFFSNSSSKIIECFYRVSLTTYL